MKNHCEHLFGDEEGSDFNQAFQKGHYYTLPDGVSRLEYKHQKDDYSNPNHKQLYTVTFSVVQTRELVFFGKLIVLKRIHRGTAYKAVIQTDGGVSHVILFNKQFRRFLRLTFVGKQLMAVNWLK
jgi:hypothetical protein